MVKVRRGVKSIRKEFPPVWDDDESKFPEGKLVRVVGSLSEDWRILIPISITRRILVGGSEYINPTLAPCHRMV